METKRLLLEQVRNHPNPEVRNLFRDKDYSKMFIVYSKKLHSRVHGKCCKCGLPLQIGDVVIRRRVLGLLGRHTYYYHVECYLETLH